MAPDHPVFRQLAALASPQLFLARRPWDDKAERLRTAITVDEVRALKGFFQLSAADGGRRVAIVDAADELNAAAANALLKILEEPPARAVLLLVSHRPAGLLPTHPLALPRAALRAARPRRRSPRALAAAGAAPTRPTPPRSRRSPAARSARRSTSSPATASRLYAEIVALLAPRPLDRRRAIALAEAAAGRAAAARYALTLELVQPRPRPPRAAPAPARAVAPVSRGRGRALRPPRRHARRRRRLWADAGARGSPSAPPTPARSTLTPPR